MNKTVLSALLLLPLTGQHCDPSLWQHVYKPSRLIVQPQGCISVTGTIVDATHGKRRDGLRHEPDGDTHGWISIDAPYRHLLNAGNLKHEGGNLVFELVCFYHVSQDDAKAACKGYASALKVPAVGSRVRMTGTYVQDQNHAKWMEIHPVSSIELLSGGVP